MKNKLPIIASILMLFFTTRYKAQLSGTYLVPGPTYTSIATVIDSLNILGVNGPVTINVAANYIENAPDGGYTLYSIPGASATNQITFQKSGAGINPLIMSYIGNATPTSAFQDGIWRFEGADYVTIDGIDLIDRNTSNPATMEFGYGFFKADGTNGCQNNTIKNCVITLNAMNNAVGSGAAVDGSRGIDMVNASTRTHTTSLVATTIDGSNSNNKFYGNTIQNCNIGIALIGYVGVSPFPFSDRGNDLGGSSAATGNTIRNFGGGGNLSASAGIRTLAQYDLSISYNTINSNDGNGVNHTAILRGIYMNTAAGASAAITNNTLTVKGGGTFHQITAIENGAGSIAASNSITINNNLITGCTYPTATTGYFYGVYNTSSPSTLSINSNTFTGNSINATSGSTFFNIHNTGSVASNLQINNNAISSTSLNAVPSSVVFRGISITSSGANAMVSADGNSLQGVSYAGTTNQIFSFLFISSAGGTVSVSSNTMGGLTVPTTVNCYFINNSNVTANSIVSNNTMNGVFNKTGAGGSFYGYYNGNTVASAGTSIISNNNFSNVTLTGATGFYGIYQETNTSQNSSILTNTISNIIGGTSTMNGIGFGSGNNNNNIIGNLITNLSGGGSVNGIIIEGSTSTLLNVATNTISALTTSGSNNIYGYFQATGNTTNFYKNKIYDISCTKANSTLGVFGAFISTGTTNRLYNNLISDLRSPSVIGNGIITGINIGSSAVNNSLYYNTVHLNAASTSTLFGSSAISANTSSNLDLRNNIFSNTSIPTGTGVTVAYRRNASGLSTYSNLSNNNLFYAGTPGANNVIFYDGTNSAQTISSYKAFMATRDGVSVSELPVFTSTVGSNANFLNIDPSTPTQIEAGGTTIAGYTDDYAGTIRNINTPDIGAWEGNYTLLDTQAPLVSGAQVSSGCSLTSVSINATISDATGVATGTLSPRLYYTINGGTYSSVQGTLVSGTIYSGTWAFAPTFTSNIADVISYYITAQDITASNNLCANPSAGYVGTNVNTTTTPPTAPTTYTLYGSLNGIYTIGAGQTFPTLTYAANIYNNACISGPVKFVLTDALYSSAETFPIVFKANSYASSTNSLMISPDATVSCIINSTNATAGTVIKFLNASYITLDGLNSGGARLTINNPNTSTASANIWLASNVSGNNTIAIKNTTLNGGSNSNTTTFGIVACVDGASPSITGGANNDNVIISGNTILKAYYAIWASGTSAVSSGGMDNLTISGNQVGPATNGADNIGGSGIAVLNALNLTISNNLIQNVRTINSNKAGIHLSSNVNVATISQNTITSIYCSGTSLGVNAVSAINMAANVINTTIDANYISTIVSTNSSGGGAKGIIIYSGNAASNITVSNNFITDIFGYGDTGSGYWIMGIHVDLATGKVNIDNNTVNLFGSHVGRPFTTSSAALYLNATGGNINVLNNILANTYDNSSVASDINYSIYSNVPSSNYTAIDNNDYYVGGTGNNPMLAFIGSARNNLTALQTGFGGNANSKNIAPVFVSDMDLHLIPTSNAALDNLGAPIVGITTDIDNQLRDLTTPDMGADEFVLPACFGTTSGTITALSSSICEGNALTLNSLGASTGGSINYQWKISNVSGGSYTNVSGGSGATTTTYSNSSLSTGTYYLVLETTCPAASVTVLSNEISMTVNASPTISVNSGTICSGQSFTLIPNGASTYTYSGGSDVVNPTANTIYTVSGTAVNGCVSSGIASVTVNGLPIISVNSGTICAGQTFTIVPTGASTYTYSNGSNVVNPIADATYTVNGTDANGCRSSMYAIASVTVNALPTISVNSGVICSGQSFTLIPTGANTYTYSSGGNVVSPTANATYSVSGTDLNGCVSSVDAIASVTVNALPTISVNSGAICEGQTFTLVPTGASTYSYSGGSNVVNPTADATYSVSGTDSNGCVSSIDAISSVTVNALPTISVNSGAICAGQSFTLIPIGASTYTYSSGSNVVNPTTDATYTVSGTDANGCNSSIYAIASVTVNALPIISVNSGAICAGQSFTLVPTGASTYTYSNGSNIVSPIANATYSVSGTDVNGCESSIDAITSVTVNTIPVISVNSGSICAGQSFTMNPTGANTYTYSSGSNVVNPTSDATYTINGTDVNGCENTVVSMITVNSLPALTVSSNISMLCSGQTSTLTVSGAVSYTWSTSENTTDILVNPTSTTTYTVSGENSNNCISTATITQDVSICTGISNQNNDDVSVNVYPNPTNGYFNVDLHSMSTLTINNSLGQTIYSETVEAGTYNFNLQNQSSGVYFVKIGQADKQYIIKLIKQ